MESPFLILGVLVFGLWFLKLIAEKLAD